MAKTAARTKATTAKRSDAKTTRKPAARTPAKPKREKKPAPAIAPGETGPKKVAKSKPVEKPKASKPMSMRDLLEARQARVRQGPAWPDADPHNHRATENLAPSAAEKASNEAHAAEGRNMDPEERDRRTRKEPRGPR